MLGLPQFKAMLLLYAICLTSTITSKWPGGSWRFVSVNVTSIVLLAWFVSISCSSWKMTRKINNSLVVLSLLLSITTVAKYVGGRASIIGTAYDPNDLAFVLVVLMPFVYYRSLRAKGVITKMVLYCILLLDVYTIILTQSRGGLLGLIIVAFFIIVIERQKRILLVLAGSVVGIIMYSFVPEEFISRVYMIGNRSRDYNISATEGRLEIWKRGVGFMFQYPLLGVGPNSFSTADGESRGGTGKWSVAHNSFIQIGAELGIIGFVTFVYMIVSCVKSLRILRLNMQAGSQEYTDLCAIEVAFYGYAVSGFFLSQGYSALLYILIGLSGGTAYRSDRVLTRPCLTRD